MKTFSREQWEKTYDYLSAINPLVKIMLPFDELLTKDIDELRDNIITATSAKYMVDDNMRSKIPSNELQRVVLTEINDYGHSLVLATDFNEFDKELSDRKLVITDEMKQAVFHQKRDVNLNITGEVYYVRLQGKNAFVTFGSNEYECKHISFITSNGNMEFYFPINNSRRVFIAAHSMKCTGCKHKLCIHNASTSSIALHDSLINDWMMTPPKAYDMKNAKCHSAAMAYISLYQLSKALMSYESVLYSKRSNHRENRKSSNGDKPVSADKVSTSDDSVKVVMSAEDKVNEVWVNVSQVKSGKHTYSSTHASPVAHSVDGYWRRRSKNDPTMIFVKSFARGGSAEERDIINKEIKHKQKVFKV